MTKERYRELRTRLAFEPSWTVAGLVLVLNGAVFAAAAWLLQQQGWMPYLLSQTLFSIGFFQAFGVLHECGHDSFTSSKAANVLIGHVAGLLCFQPFYSWKHIHHQHHVFSGHLEEDPSLTALNKWRSTGHVPFLARFAWRSWIPLVALAQHTVYWLYPLKLWRGGERRKVLECSASSTLMLVGYAGVIWAAATAEAGCNIVLAIALYLVAVELVNLPHHTDLPSFHRRLGVWEQWKTTRSCYYPIILGEFCVLNFNFHTEHHLFPTLPWFRLRHARSLVREALGAEYNEAVGIGWNMENRSRSLATVALAKPHGLASDADPRGISLRR